MSTYLARVEHVGDYFNIRPVLEMMEGGFVEVDSQKFGQYGTITISAIYGQYSESPFIQDRKYVMFTLDDTELAQLEKTYSGCKIKAVDFIAKSKTLDSFRIREVIKLDENYDFDRFYEWQNDIIADILDPMTMLIYLSNGSQIMGPFSYNKIGENAYKFSPASSGENPYIVNAYNISDFEDPIYEFDESRRNSDLYYGKQRHIIIASELPESNGQIDCIDDESLRELAGRCMANTSETKQAQKEAKMAVMSLPDIQLTEARKERLLKMFEDGEMTDKVISTMPQTILNDQQSMEKIVESILGNSNYTDKIYSIVKSQEQFGDIFAKLDDEKKAKQAELDDLQKKAEILNDKIKDGQNVNEEEIKQLSDENLNLKNQLKKYEDFENLQNEIQKLQKEREDLENQYGQLIKLKDSVSGEIKKKVSEAYTNVAFDGALSSMMLHEAAKYEESEKANSVKSYILSKKECEDQSKISEPKELIEFVYSELNNAAKREIAYNDVANILLCWSQSFLSILAGEPGSGKTSLVSLIANILGISNAKHNRYAEIAVEKGWTSRRDFIGYYNPLTKSLDAANGDMLKVLEVMKAETENRVSDFPYVVLLDEANLSQMEHYWADFMGLCDMNKKVRSVSLGENYVYPISDTLRFVATINLDHTTELLSPRLVDRAWIILIQSSDILIDEIEEVESHKEYPIVKFDVLKRLYDSKYWSSKSLDTAIIEKFNRIRTCFQAIGVSFSPRIIGMIKKYCLASKMVMDFSGNVYTALDYAVAQKVLPMINGYGEQYHEFLQRLLLECDRNTMPKCNEIIQTILKKGDINMQYYQFFAR